MLIQIFKRYPCQLFFTFIVRLLCVVTPAIYLKEDWKSRANLPLEGVRNTWPRSGNCYNRRHQALNLRLKEERQMTTMMRGNNVAFMAKKQRTCCRYFSRNMTNYAIVLALVHSYSVWIRGIAFLTFTRQRFVYSWSPKRLGDMMSSDATIYNKDVHDFTCVRAWF